MDRDAARGPRATEASHFRYCPVCGTRLERHEKAGRYRPVCRHCGFVQWRNPVVGVAAVIFESMVREVIGPSAMAAGTMAGSGLIGLGGRASDSLDRVLLVRRAASRRGAWCLPCGYVEVDEEIRDALIREIREETGLEVVPGDVAAVHSNFHDPDRQSVGVWFHARPVGGRLRAGDDAESIGFFDPAAPPDPLAFPTDALVLRGLSGGCGSTIADGES